MKKLVMVLAVMALTGCVTSHRNASVDSVHTAQNSLDWGGLYEGVLPCADCDGIKTSLTLSYDGSYKLEEAYQQGNLTFIPQASQGKFVWEKTRPVIHLADGNEQRIFFVGEGYVTAYDIDGNPIESQLNYTLKQVQTFDTNNNSK